MFEFSIAKGYLWPKRKQLSRSLISIMSVFVISLVVWLLLLFLSITEGIEKNWLHKLTSLNAPIRIVPTNAYYNSYYYQVDSISSQSNFQYKSIGEKLAASLSDPYDPEMDEEIPFYWPKEGRENLDLVKELFDGLEELKTKRGDLAFQDYEITGSLMRLRLVRPETRLMGNGGQSFLTQASYIASFAEKNPKLNTLIKPPSVADINHLLYLGALTNLESPLEDRPQPISTFLAEHSNPIAIPSILNHITLESVRLSSTSWQMPLQFLPLHAKFKAYPFKNKGSISYFVLPIDENSPSSLEAGILERGEEGIVFSSREGAVLLKEEIPLFINEDLVCKASSSPNELHIIMEIQGKTLSGEIPWRDLKIEQAKIHTDFDEAPTIPPPWVYSVRGQYKLPRQGIAIPIQFRENQVLLGDSGFLAYNAVTPTASVEHRNPVYVAGFYDPGIMSVGAKVVLADPSIVRTISLSGQNISMDPLMTTGIAVWFQDLSQTESIAAQIKKNLAKKGLASFWKVIPFQEYDFARALIMQFKSDRYLFVIIGIIILIVACCNIISQLLLLVNDKKQEIGILLSLGAKRRSIALVFGLCGITMGILSCALGTLLAYFTLSHIDSLVHLLSTLEGQEAFNAAFYGESLPSELSRTAFLFIIIVTPVLSFIAGLIPAIKACRLKPANLLRAD